MVKKTISYTNYNGEPVTEDYYFNLNEAELVELEAEFPDGIEGIVMTKNRKDVIKFVKLLIINSVGVKTDAGRFEKPENYGVDFYFSGAYPKLFTDILKDQDAIMAFMKGVLPADALAKANDTSLI